MPNEICLSPAVCAVTNCADLSQLSDGCTEENRR